MELDKDEVDLLEKGDDGAPGDGDGDAPGDDLPPSDDDEGEEEDEAAGGRADGTAEVRVQRTGETHSTRGAALAAAAAIRAASALCPGVHRAARSRPCLRRCGVALLGLTACASCLPCVQPKSHTKQSLARAEKRRLRELKQRQEEELERIREAQNKAISAEGVRFLFPPSTAPPPARPASPASPA